MSPLSTVDVDEADRVPASRQPASEWADGASFEHQHTLFQVRTLSCCCCRKEGGRLRPLPTLKVEGGEAHPRCWCRKEGRIY